jgi:hypothetical protein
VGVGVWERASAFCLLLDPEMAQQYHCTVELHFYAKKNTILFTTYPA